MLVHFYLRIFCSLLDYNSFAQKAKKYAWIEYDVTCLKRLENTLTNMYDVLCYVGG